VLRWLLGCLLAVLFLSTHLSAATSAVATGDVIFSNQCFVVTCPGDHTLYTCSDVVTPETYGVIVDSSCPGVAPPQVLCTPPPGTPLGLGVHPIACVVLVGNEVVAKCDFKITVVRDTEPPKIECPRDLTVLTCMDPTGLCGAVVNYPAPVASDNSGTVAVVCNPPSGSVFPCGTTVVTCRAFDRCHNVSECKFLVTVKDGGKPPVIKCPPDVVAYTCGETAVVDYPDPTVNPPTTPFACFPPSGSVFTLGTHTVICVASNACGIDRCTFTVTVKHLPRVSIQCPTEKFVFRMPCTSNCVPVNFPLPVVSDGTLESCNPPPGSCLSPGVHTIVCRATNECSTATCEFTVVVIKDAGTPPAIECPKDIVVQSCDKCEVVKYPLPVVTGGSLAFCNPPPGTCFPLGVTTVTCMATNECGLQAECVFTVTVRPRPQVSIQCPTAPITVRIPCTSNCVPVNYPLPTVLNGTLESCNPPPGTCLPAGDHVVLCRATNGCSVATCEFVVHVVPVTTEPPVIRCPQDIVVFTCSDCRKVLYPDPVVVNGTLAFCTPPSGSCFPVGSTTVTCVATNECGQKAECSFQVIVRTAEKLQIKCPPDIVVKACSPCEKVTYPAPTVVGGALAVCTPPSGTCFPIGTTTVHCVATNECEKVECTFTVTVEQTRCVKPPANMVLWLPFDEPVGIVANNIIAGAPNGVHVNGPVPILGQKVLNSLRFDGQNDFVAVPNYAAIILNQSDLSIDAWVFRRDTEGGRRVIVSKMAPLAGAAGVRGYEFYLNNGNMNLLLGGPVAQNFNSGVTVPIDGNWHHVAVTVARGPVGVVRFYLDGVIAASQPGPITAPIGNSGRLHVGASTWPAPQGFFRGGIDEVEIFSRALSAAEVHALWAADSAGKCKIKCYIPWDVSFPPGDGYVTVPAYVFNDTPYPQPIAWTASGPMPIPVPSGSFVIAPFSITNVPVKLCRPTNDVPVGTVVTWDFTLFPDNLCPIGCMGSVIHPGKARATVPDNVIPVPGTTRAVRVRVGLNGLLLGAPVRFMAIGPDMEPDMDFISLNGLPPGTPFIVEPGLVTPAADEMFVDVPVRFVHSDPTDNFTILVDTDVNGDGAYDTLASFDVSNPVIPPPVLRFEDRADGRHLLWEDEGDGILQSAPTVEGPWKTIEGGRPGYLVTPSEKQLFFRVEVPVDDGLLPAVQ
jgi:hypothetical protein